MTSAAGIDGERLLRQLLLDNGPQAWLFAALAFLLTFTILPLLRGVLRSRAARYADHTLPLPAALTAHLAEHTSRVVLWIVALSAAERILTLPHAVDRVFNIAITLGFWLQIGIWGAAAAQFGLQRQQARTGDMRLSSTMDIVLFVLRLILWTVVVLLALENLGVSVGPLIAGLGVGGIAIALAVQTILGDLFASLSIALDKPFVIGDALRVDAFEGVVEHIGIKSTRLRSVTGEQIILANADLLKSRVRNLGRASEWRALFTLAVAYDTAGAKLELVPRLVQQAVATYPDTRFVYCLLTQLGDCALRFEVCFYVANRPGRDLTRALDQVNRQILHSFREQSIEFAFPAQTVWVRTSAAGAAPARGVVESPGEV